MDSKIAKLVCGKVNARRVSIPKPTYEPGNSVLHALSLLGRPSPFDWKCDLGFILTFFPLCPLFSPSSLLHIRYSYSMNISISSCSR
jgi:hypothetical protein